MRIPKSIDSNWIDSLDNEELQDAESSLHGTFQKHDRRERNLRGQLYELLMGPEALLLSWTRWSVVNNAIRARRLPTRLRAT